MITLLRTAALLLLVATPALAEGDAAKGAKEFVKCKACHSIVAPDGAVVVRGGKTGPNLWGVIGRQAGGLDGFGGYGDSLTALGQSGFAWTPAELVTYAGDPQGFLENKLGASNAHSTMTFKLRAAEDVVAYLAEFTAG